MLGGIIAAATSAIGSQIKGIEAREAVISSSEPYGFLTVEVKNPTGLWYYF